MSNLERISDDDWEKKVRPNLATMPTEQLLSLAKSMRTGNFNKTMEILSEFIKQEEHLILETKREDIAELDR